MLKILPSNLKTLMAIFLYREAISSIKFLQARHHTFYESYLEKLRPLRFKKGDFILKEGLKTKEVLFVMSGNVLNVTTGRVFNEGSMLGETDIVFKRHRKDSFVADTECYILKYDKSIFEKILDEFPDIKEEVEEVA